MMQGDQYRVPLQLTLNGEIVTDEIVENVEVMLGNIRKTKEENVVTYDALQEAWLISLTQQDTFLLRGSIKVTVRCKFNSGDVIGVDLGMIDILHSASKVVL